MSETSDRYRDLYRETYAGGVERDWRDSGAVYKAKNVVEAWSAVGGEERPDVVELGCGDGALSARLSADGFYSRYRGFDLSPSGIEEAKSRGLGQAHFEISEGARVPLPSDTADLVVLSHVVEHLEHPRQLIYEASRLAPWVVVEVPLEHHRRMPANFVWTSLGHINFYDATTIRQLLQTCDLEVKWQKTTHPGGGSYFFTGRGARRRISYAVKTASLKLAPPVARQLFTYHETLIARRI